MKTSRINEELQGSFKQFVLRSTNIQIDRNCCQALLPFSNERGTMPRPNYEISSFVALFQNRRDNGKPLALQFPKSRKFNTLIR